MSDFSSKDPVSLYDLKCAIQRVEAWRATPHKDPTIEAERDAWRTAFEWRDSVSWNASPAHYNEGMALIREKLT